MHDIIASSLVCSAPAGRCCSTPGLQLKFPRPPEAAGGTVSASGSASSLPPQPPTSSSTLSNVNGNGDISHIHIYRMHLCPSAHGSIGPVPLYPTFRSSVHFFVNFSVVIAAIALVVRWKCECADPSGVVNVNHFTHMNVSIQSCLIKNMIWCMRRSHGSR